MTPSLTFSDVSAGYGDQVVVRDVSFSVAPGEVVAVFGANGAGKSTILRSAMKTARVFQGTISIFGESVQPLRPHEVPGLGVGIVLQGDAVFPSLSVWENLLLPIRTGGRVAGEEARAALGLFPELEPHLRKTAGLLSGGERQLVALCRALVGDPSLLLLDEPGAGLAPDLLIRMLDRVKGIAHERGKGVLLVEQNVSSALKKVDRVLVMRRGKLIFKGSGGSIELEDVAGLMLDSEREAPRDRTRPN